MTYKQRHEINKKSKQLLHLNELYHNYLYLNSFNNYEDVLKEKQRLLTIFNTK